jgi:hypothetical protein
MPHGIGFNTTEAGLSMLIISTIKILVNLPFPYIRAFGIGTEKYAFNDDVTIGYGQDST